MDKILDKYKVSEKIKAALKYDIPIFIVLLILIILMIIVIIITTMIAIFDPLEAPLIPLATLEFLEIIYIIIFIHLLSGFSMFLLLRYYKKKKYLPENTNILSWWKASLLGFGYKHVMKEEYLDASYKARKLKFQKYRKNKS